MQAFKVFIKERLPIIPNFILAFGLMFSAYAISGVSLSAGALLFGVIALFLFVSELRFMDELKDVQKDIVANPDRPLPRGAITKDQVYQLILGTGILLVVFAALAGEGFGAIPSALFFVSIIWLYLMYKEFFIGEWLSAKPMLYAISHQIVIFPLCLFAIALFSSDIAFNLKSFAFGALILSAFFTFEVGRKLDPHAHEILKTYLVQYGPKAVIGILCILQTIAIIAGYLLDVFWWVAVPAILILLTLPSLVKKPEDFKKLEGLIALNLIYTVWVVAIQRGVASL